MEAPSREFCLLVKSRLSDALQSDGRGTSLDALYVSRSRPVLGEWGGQDADA
jgi:hypothetical protein